MPAEVPETVLEVHLVEQSERPEVIISMEVQVELPCPVAGHQEVVVVQVVEVQDRLVGCEATAEEDQYQENPHLDHNRY